TLEVYLAGGAVIRFLNYLQLITWLFVVVSAFLMLTAIHMVIRRATATINDTNETMASLNERLAESNAYLNQTGVGTVNAFLSALDAKDRYTAQHSVNVATYVEKIARKLGLTPQDLELVREAALLHDIGKIGVPENVLNKPGKLNSDEYEMIKRHSEIGAEIIHSIYFLEEVAEIIRYHHERVDGSGYPKGMVGEEIPLTARILAVADVYDALTTDRPYRKAMSPQQAKAILVAEAGKNFDPAVVKALCAVIAEEVAA
ncbi:MAG TPA: HD-GYP domain-containing protein, partial [Desulfobacteria bacterium]|nr:HD-GYP domain-containing protein [Desulfobacteria bacterium]